MKKLSGRKILGVFIFCFVSIVVCGNLPATKRNDLALCLSQLHCISAIYIFTISSENQSFQATSNAVIQQHCVVYTPYNNNTGAFVLPVHFISKSKFKYNRVAPVPQAQVADMLRLALYNVSVSAVNDTYSTFYNFLQKLPIGRSALAFHTKWQASGNYQSLQIFSKIRSL